ncbi:hypothetical protein COV19_01950 [Candidatus Woesearchaeota archaeon CG10_big_fil_rev_8_21_14_0_10_44_13]|nr:MAG: hypothetical protein COV19_01950 [Candidatus Woesearchaeota archaeon CG10_big_fil_rev_8_21_14_0_10_44_13]
MRGVYIFFAGSIILGLIASLLAFYAKKKAIDENKEFLKFYSAGVLITCIGFSLHTAGDLVETLYDSVRTGMIMESIAHVILFASFLIFVVSAKRILKSSKQFWFR